MTKKSKDLTSKNALLNNSYNYKIKQFNICLKEKKCSGGNHILKPVTICLFKQIVDQTEIRLATSCVCHRDANHTHLFLTVSAISRHSGPLIYSFTAT